MTNEPREAGRVAHEDKLIDCDVVLTSGEVNELTALAAKRYNAMRSDPMGWWMLGAQAGLGVLVAGFAVLAHAARPEKAGIIAVASFLACRAAVWVQARAFARVRRRQRAQQWEALGYTYTVAAWGSGVRVAFGDQVAETAWRGYSHVERCGALVVLWNKQGSLLAIPERALPPDEAAVLIDRFAVCIHQAQAR